MSRFLLVPVRTDALCLTKDRADSYDFIQPHDYTSHPVYDRIIYAGGWEPTSLEAGVHLHWSLPDPLTTSAPLVPRGVLRNLGLRKRLDGEQARALRHEDFPAVPNRWLVERLDASGHLPAAQWMIHSDRLSQDGRTLGHAERLPATPAPRSPAISKLTVQGFGNPWFAALYQNCRNVFGFHDAESGARASFTDCAHHGISACDSGRTATSGSRDSGPRSRLPRWRCARGIPCSKPWPGWRRSPLRRT